MPPAEKSALILLNGEIPDAKIVKKAAARCRGVVCADGGVRHAAALKLRADFVVGDMDSLPRPLPRDPETIYWCDFDEQRSDFEKALEFAAGMGCARAYVAGALGGRTDHVLINLAVFERYTGALELVLLDRGFARMLGSGRHLLAAAKGARFSILAAPRALVTLRGAQYPLRRFALERGSRGLGNRSLGRPALTVHSGRVWLLLDR